MRVSDGHSIVPTRRDSMEDDLFTIELLLGAKPVKDNRPQSIWVIWVIPDRGTVTCSRDIDAHDRVPSGDMFRDKSGLVCPIAVQTANKQNNRSWRR